MIIYSFPLSGRWGTDLLSVGTSTAITPRINELRSVYVFTMAVVSQALYPQGAATSARLSTSNLLRVPSTSLRRFALELGAISPDPHPTHGFLIIQTYEVLRTLDARNRRSFPMEYLRHDSHHNLTMSWKPVPRVVQILLGSAFASAACSVKTLLAMPSFLT